MEYKECPNCNKKLNGIMSTNEIVDQNTKVFIEISNKNLSDAYCSGCAPVLIQNSINKIKFIYEELNNLIKCLPIITVNNPIGWDYEVIEMVSAQSVAGTGLFTELSSGFSDLMGTQSNSLNNKLSNGEMLCKNQLRYKAALLGGNAIIATDVDYAEVGGSKAMIMVCMAGTAIVIKNKQDIFKDKFSQLLRIDEILNQIRNFESLKYTEY